MTTTTSAPAPVSRTTDTDDTGPAAPTLHVEPEYEDGSGLIRGIMFGLPVALTLWVIIGGVVFAVSRAFAS